MLIQIYTRKTAIGIDNFISIADTHFLGFTLELVEVNYPNKQNPKITWSLS
ncbi:MAG: hypothetical protein F6K18_05125 [Okeania sp. SIO2C2]|uniref:hypothetical protein n=1 Tax=Okeania sp. SIO2C2 TaxID=2607787 RepID=UPI0013BD8ABF|nr:hypothetical protein [Okeania sp. SIO2C2]NEP86254.1 hypothetical protein [Okeania sp. SIO2C2]